MTPTLAHVSGTDDRLGLPKICRAKNAPCAYRLAVRPSNEHPRGGHSAQNLISRAF